MMHDMSGQEIRLGIEALSRFMPMHLLLDAEDRVLSVGPTLQRVLDGISTLGARFEDLFEVRAPGGAGKMSDVLDARRTGSAWPRATSVTSPCGGWGSAWGRMGRSF
jgi:hypothetical protein